MDEWVIGLLTVAATLIVGQWMAIAHLYKKQNGVRDKTKDGHVLALDPRTIPSGQMSVSYWSEKFSVLECKLDDVLEIVECPEERRRLNSIKEELTESKQLMLESGEG